MFATWDNGKAVAENMAVRLAALATYCVLTWTATTSRAKNEYFFLSIRNLQKQTTHDLILANFPLYVSAKFLDSTQQYRYMDPLPQFCQSLSVSRLAGKSLCKKPVT
jgi:hypothetical protein